MRLLILTCLCAACGPVVSLAQSCGGCARPDLINVFNQALHAVTAAPGSVAVLPFSADDSESRGMLSVRIPSSFRTCSCGEDRYLRYHFAITDVVGSISRAGRLWSPAQRSCFKEAQTLPLGPGPNPDLTIDVHWGDGSRRPFVGIPTPGSKLQMLKVGRWRSFNEAIESSCSMLCTASYMDLRSAFRGWMVEIERRLGNVLADLNRGNR